MKNFTDRTVFFVLQGLNIVFSLDSVLIKYVSVSWQKEGLFSYKTCFLLVTAVSVLGIYAVLWQMVLSKVRLTAAYLSKGLCVFWGLLWAAVFFDDQVTAVNLAAAALIFCGTVLVNSHE